MSHITNGFEFVRHVEKLEKTGEKPRIEDMKVEEIV